VGGWPGPLLNFRHGVRNFLECPPLGYSTRSMGQHSQLQAAGGLDRRQEGKEKGRADCDVHMCSVTCSKGDLPDAWA
jgi:hypothetical protein